MCGPSRGGGGLTRPPEGRYRRRWSRRGVCWVASGGGAAARPGGQGRGTRARVGGLGKPPRQAGGQEEARRDKEGEGRWVDQGRGRTGRSRRPGRAELDKRPDRAASRAVERCGEQDGEQSGRTVRRARRRAERSDRAASKTASRAVGPCGEQGDEQGDGLRRRAEAAGQAAGRRKAPCRDKAGEGQAGGSGPREQAAVTTAGTSRAARTAGPWGGGRARPGQGSGQVAVTRAEGGAIERVQHRDGRHAAADRARHPVGEAAGKRRGSQRLGRRPGHKPGTRGRRAGQRQPNRVRDQVRQGPGRAVASRGVRPR